MSTGPAASTTPATPRATSPVSATSIASPRWPSPVRPAATACAAAASRSATATRCPAAANRAHTAAPIAPAPPVTRAVRRSTPLPFHAVRAAGGAAGLGPRVAMVPAACRRRRDRRRSADRTGARMGADRRRHRFPRRPRAGHVDVPRRLEIDLPGARRADPPSSHRVGGASLALAIIIGTSLTSIDGARSGLLVGLAITTTAFGILLPIRRDRGELPTRFGTEVLAGAAVGEIGPIVVIAVRHGSTRPRPRPAARLLRRRRARRGAGDGVGAAVPPRRGAAAAAGVAAR